MLKIDTFRMLIARGLMLAPLCWSIPAFSAPAEVLSDAQSTAIRAAAARSDQGAMYALIFSAISQRPEQTAEIVAEAVTLVPEHRDAILSTVGAAFPAQAGQFAALTEKPSSRGTAATVPVPAPSPELISEPPPPSEVGDAAIETAEAVSDAEADDKKRPLWSGEGQLGAATNSGNTKNDSINAAAKLVWAPGNWENELRASYNFYNDSGTTTERRLEASAGPRYNITDRFFVWGGARLVDDKNDGFQWVLTEAIGPGYRLVNTDDLKLTVSAGPGLQQTREKQDNGGDLNNEVVGVGIVNFEWTFVENATFSNDFRISSGQERTRLNNLSALTLKIYGDLAGRLSYEVRHDSSPGDDKKKTNTTGLASIVYSFETE